LAVALCLGQVEVAKNLVSKGCVCETLILSDLENRYPPGNGWRSRDPQDWLYDVNPEADPLSTARSVFDYGRSMYKVLLLQWSTWWERTNSNTIKGRNLSSVDIIALFACPVPFCPSWNTRFTKKRRTRTPVKGVLVKRKPELQDEIDAGLAVVVEVVHDEPAAEISPTESQQIVQVQWSQNVELLSQQLQVPSDRDGHERILLITLNRSPQHFFSKLHQTMQQYIEALESEGYSCKLPGGAHIFVSPEQYRLAIGSLPRRGLKPSHVVVAQSLEYLVGEAMDQCSIKGCYAKQRECINEESDEDVDSSVIAPSLRDDECQNSLGPIFSVKRTFLCCSPEPQMADSVVQSTTDADSRNGLNPRRRALNCAYE